MRPILPLLIVLTAMAAAASAQAPWPYPVEWKPPPEGMVPDAPTAVKVALAVLPQLGPLAKREIRDFQPWHADKVGDAWQVRGTLPASTVGGTYVVVIAQRDARIIGIFHEQ